MLSSAGATVIPLGRLAAELAAELQGDPGLPIARIVHPVQAEGASDLAVAFEPAARRLLPQTRAGAALLDAAAPPPESGPSARLLVPQPRYALARLLELFDRPLTVIPGIHPSAVIEPSATIEEDVSIGPLTYIGAGARIGRGTVVMSQVTVGAGAMIGAQCRLHAGVRLGERVVLGDRVILQHNCSIGADGFGYVSPAQEPNTAPSERPHPRRMNSIGTVILGDDVEVGANSAVDRGTLGATTIGPGTKIDNLVQIGHNTTVGRDCLICGCTGISGSCIVGDRVVIAAAVTAADHIAIGDDSILLMGSVVVKDVPAGTMVFGYPAKAKAESFREQVLLGRLGKLFDGFAELRRRVGRIEGGRGNDGQP